MNLRLEKRGLQLLSFAFSKYYSSFFFCSASWVILTLIKKNGMSIANPVGMPLLWIQPRWAMCCYQIWKTWMSKISTTHCCLLVHRYSCRGCVCECNTISSNVLRSLMNKTLENLILAVVAIFTSLHPS